MFLLSSAAFCDFIADIVQKLRTLQVCSTHFFSCAGSKRAILSGQDSTGGRLEHVLFLYHLPYYDDSLSRRLTCSDSVRFLHVLFLYHLPYYDDSLSRRLICSDSVRFLKVLLGQTTTPGSTFPTLCDKCVGSLTSPTNYSTEKIQETGPTAFRPHPRTLECPTACRYHNKGSTSSSVILRP